jgi:hypothetical protein
MLDDKWNLRIDDFIKALPRQVENAIKKMKEDK